MRPPSLATTLSPTPHATAVVAVLALYAVLRAHVLASGTPGAATMREWEPMAAAAAVASVVARVASVAGRRGGSSLHTVAAALPIAGRVAQLTAASLLLTASPAAGAWLVAAAGTAAALVPAEPAFAPGSAVDTALPATTPAAAADAAKLGGAGSYVLLLYDPAGGARAAAAVAALARFAAARSERPDPPTFARLDAARWPEAAAALAGGGGEDQSGGAQILAALPVVVVWAGGQAVTRVQGRRAPTTADGWERALSL
jgi:hypothetical protein